MGLQALDIPEAATEIIGALSLTDGQYRMQNVGDVPIIINEQDSAHATPDDLRAVGGLILYPGEKIPYTVVSGKATYLWSRSPGSRVAIVEAA